MNITVQHVIVALLVIAAIWVAARSLCGLPVLRWRSSGKKESGCDRCTRR